MTRRRPIEDMYPLTPMQEGMLFHSLLAPASGVYVQQVSATLRGRVQPEVLRSAWQALVDRHPVLRTSFVWDRRTPPFQVVHREVALPWTVEDWRGVATDEQQSRLDAWIRADRQRGFALDRPPLMRVALFLLADDRAQVVWSHHHLLIDGWSVPLILAELVASYEAKLAGTALALPARRPYRDFVAWLRDRADTAGAEAFWRARVGDLEAPTTLASANPSGDDAGEMAECLVRLTADESLALQQFARDHQLTMNTLAQGAWAIVLARHAGDARVVFGTTVSGRPPDLPGADAMIGLFINTLPVRVGVPEATPLVTWLATLQADLVAARRFEHTPLTAIQGWSGVPREVLLFESLVVFENYPVDPDQASRATGFVIEHADSLERTNYPLTLVVIPGRELIVKADYDTSRFEATTMARLLSGLARVLTGFVASARSPVAQVPWLDPDERRRVVTGWNRTATPPAALVHERFAAQARRTPDAVAVRQDGRTLSFADLATRVTAFAQRLSTLGVGPDVRVALALPPGMDAIVALLAVLEAGGAYVPIDPTYPDARKRFVADDCGAAIVVATEEAAWIPAGLTRVSPASAVEDLAASAPAAPLRPVSGDNLAYVIYTSGSTGQPKGAMITHRGLANYLDWAIDAYDVASGTGAPLHSSLGFDLTVTSLFPPLLAGRAIDVVASGDGVDPLADVLSGSPGYSLVKITPAHLESVGHVMKPASAAASTKRLVIGGEALLESHVAFWRTHAPATRLINEYGPTETVVGCCVHDATDDAPAKSAIPIGRPIANTRLYILDRTGEPVPVGVAGELFIGGAGVARGYQGRPDLTAERFVPDPFGDEPGARLYRSGDRARYREDGVIEYLGRLDTQFKVRGFRIEPGEIEAALRGLPGVEDGAVVVQASPSGPRVVAFVVATPGNAPSEAESRAALARELPAHMVPAVVVFVDALPLTINGKVDRSALAARDVEMARPARVQHDARRAAPRGAAEELVASIWADVLGRSDIGRDDTFFELGGHSLLATRIVARVRGAFGVDVPLRALFDAPTVARFTAAIGGLRSEQGTLDDRVPLAPRPSSAGAPLSFAQQRLWFLHQLDPASTAYNIRYAVRLTGRLDVAALESSLDAVARRHEILRARFEDEGGQPRQVIDPLGTIPLERHDLRDLGGDRRSSAIASVTEADAARPFDLARGPLARASLLRLSDEEALLLLSMHHIVSDAWSVEVLVGEIAASYEASAAGTTSALAPLPVQYPDYAAWQRARLEGGAREQHLNYWREQLADVPVLDLPTDRPRPSARAFSGSTWTFTVPSAAAARVEALGRTEGVTPFMILLAVFQVLLARHAGQDDVAVGTPVANRSRAEIQGLIGFFMNTLVLRTRVSGDLSFRRLLAQVRITTLDAFAHEDLPFEEIVDRLAPTRDLAQNPLFQVMFTTTSGAPMPVTVGGLQLAPVPLETTTAKFDLSLSMAREADALIGAFEYSTELFEPATIERLAAQFVALLDQATAQPEIAVEALSMLREDERREAVETWNRTAVDHGTGGNVLDLVAAQVARTPDAIAVESESGSLTFAELWQRTARVALALRTRGVRADQVVGLCVDRGVDLVVGMIGILRAGAAYVPLDRSYPADRLAFMLQDSGAALVVADTPGRDVVGGAPPVVDVPTLEQEGSACEARGDRLPSIEPESLAYVLYTSGSTGRPRGAAIPHRALHNHMGWMQRVFPLSGDDRVLQKTPVGFDASVWEFYAPLIAGARLMMARPGGHHDVEYLGEAVRRHGVTVLQLVPSLLRMLLDAGTLAGTSTLRRVFSGGEPLTRDLQDRVFTTLGCELHNLYGPTECTIDTVVWSCRPDDQRRVVPIGFPIDNTSAYVLDGRLEPAPIGVVGELFLGGAALGRGYFGQPALTADRFVPDPFGRVPGARLYRTGDRVRRLADGALEFLGRIDGQVKVRGMRIELGEIEAVLVEHEAVREAAVVVREDAPGVRRLVAYCAPRPGAAIDAAELRTFARRRLPDHMTPAGFVALDDLPRLPNGKLDRRSLPAPTDDAAPTAARFVAPRNEVETTLAAIWAEVLGRTQVGVRDNFFEIGGDSILSLQVVSRARARGLQIAPADLFRHQTIEALAAVADQAAPVAALASGPDREIPLTPIQHWFFEQDLPAPHHWNQALMLVADDGVDVTALERALAHVARRHDVLTVGFTRTVEGWRQRVQTDAPRIRVERIDLSTVPAADREGFVRAEADRLQGSMVLDAPPLMRVAVFGEGPGRPARVLVAVHHLIVDAVSWQVLLEELAPAYEAALRGDAFPKPAAGTVSFSAWASALARHARSAVVSDERAYWLGVASSGAGTLPVDRAIARGENDERSAAWIERTLDASNTRALLHEIGGVYNTQAQDALLTALVEAVGAWTGVRRVLLDVEGHGREEFTPGADATRTVGWFTTISPLRLDLEGVTPGGPALKHVKEQVRAVPRHGLGYGLLRYLGEDAAVRDALRMAPAAEISFNYLGQVAAAAAVPGARWRPLPDGAGTLRANSPRRHLIEVVASVVEGVLRVRWIHGPAHQASTIARLADATMDALQRLIDHCRSGEAGGYTPSDFSAAGVSQRDLDKLVARLRQ